MEINDLEKRKIIQNYTHIDINKAIDNKSEDLETHSVQSTTETKHRKAQPFKTVEEKKEPQYKIINGQRVPV